MRAEFMFQLLEAVSRKDYVAMGEVVSAAATEEIRLGRKKNGYALLDIAQVVRRIPQDFDGCAVLSKDVHAVIAGAEPFEDEP